MAGASYKIETEDRTLKFIPQGVWRIGELSDLACELKANPLKKADKVIVDGSELLELDTTGALLIFHSLSFALKGACQLKHNCVIQNFKSAHQNIAVLTKDSIDREGKLQLEIHQGFLIRIGMAVCSIISETLELFGFIGETVTSTVRLVRQPGSLRVKELFVQLERVLIDAIPVNALVTFLIGVVVAYLFSVQTEKYGANIFIVESVAISLCRELSPIIVAIIVAGRSGSAFTAHLGSMKINEEIEAMETMGLSAMRVLVMPRVIALVIAMPLLVFIGDAVGIIGGMFVADMRLGITGDTFIERLHTKLPMRHVLVGMLKAPVFAAFIGVIGCRLGLGVERNAQSLGISTTATVVQSIVTVILLNAAFAVLFSELGI